ncbi:glucosaminidase domain-containing protein [Vibrio sinaloensis]|uniref:glucosaminidase domain-containing protein n=1 Tax=Photobacterium sp. (strain ATCC 43367) TaxID=379097 RepID=UPI002063E9E7|nr:glucosaminidase domain-containing protein [Vibrio sinaloensis]UPQ86766.1 glucosaminidase domain-containing protein [Vibrio sinaloensis]
MRKSEFLAIATAGIIAGCSFYSYEKNTQQVVNELSVSQTQARKVGDAPDFASISDVTQKKQTFFDYLRPGIALENKRIQKERQRLEAIQANFVEKKLSKSELQDAKRLGQLYSLELPSQGVNESWLDEMLHRVDVLPEALVLVQGANESAWGTSRFATQANNYFGQWCYSAGCGLVPLQRSEGMTHEVAKFRSVQQSIHGYFMNVNRNTAYQDLRQIRYERHLAGQSLTDIDAAMALTEGLLKYSERGEAYVNDLQAMIRHNESFWETPLANQ